MADLSILNVGQGDTKITFDKNNPAERERACKIVQDMLKLGYAILVQAGEKDGKPIFYRATAFDPETAEYIVVGVPEDSAELFREQLIKETKDMPYKVPRKGRTKIAAEGTTAVAVARSAGGMSQAADSIEMENLRKFDKFAPLRDGLATVAKLQQRWAGIPMPLADHQLVIEPTYPGAKELMAINDKPTPSTSAVEQEVRLRNIFYSVRRRAEVAIFEVDGKLEWYLRPLIHGFVHQVNTMAASSAWGIEQEARAIQLLATLVPHHTFKNYLLTGLFLESSQKSRVTYAFRRLRPTVAMAASPTGSMKILAALCMHPIAYYADSWAGAMCPTDDVIAHLMLMRGDEHMFWKRCNQHPAVRPEAGL